MRTGEHATNVTIIAEPPGGDVDIRFPRTRLVQQYKVRDEGTGSLTDIVEKTLPAGAVCRPNDCHGLHADVPCPAIHDKRK